MSDDFKPGLEGVIAFESEIAEPDKEGSALRYRGVDIDDAEARSNLARASVMVLSYLAQAARGIVAAPVPESEIDKAHTVVERMMIRWRGEPDPLHVRAIDAYFVSCLLYTSDAADE